MALLALATPVLAGAQPPARDFSGLANRVVANDPLHVVTIGGDVVEGRLVALTATTLTVREHDAAGQPILRTLQTADVREIFRLDHRAMKGAAVGALIGGGVIVVGNAAGRNGIAFRAVAGGAGVGAAIGASIGLGRRRRVRIYEAGPGPATSPRAMADSASLLRPRPVRDWDAFWVLGSTSSGPARDLERAMRDAQFDGNQGYCFLGFCLPGSDLPLSRTGIGETGVPWHVGVDRAWRGRIGLGGFVGRSAIGATRGLDRNSYAALNLSYAVSSTGLMATVAPVRGVKLGAGAAAFVTTVTQEEGPRVVTRRRHTSPGAVLEARAAVPTGTRVFAALVVQGRLLGRQRVGPYDVTDGLTGITASFPATSVRVSHWFAGVGIGTRF
jgi:hypothetical protein